MWYIATANSQSEMEQYECGTLYVHVHVFTRQRLYGTNKKRMLEKS